MKMKNILVIIVAVAVFFGFVKLLGNAMDREADFYADRVQIHLEATKYEAE